MIWWLQLAQGITRRSSDLHDTGSWLPETNSVFGTSSSQEVVDLLVDIDGSSEIFDTSDLGLDQMITVHRGWDGGLRKTGRHELENGHLGGGILTCDSLTVSGSFR